ncbi:toll/interleukin-1 receptor domain-containing protein [Flavobacterium aestivum]|uniref:toll/interleukin-1 receptor domain-containing protein n=1 Tax=Flavobacterium aestivum TaxID=3003257 RepID=UPI002482C8F2|nr:toll/interleukin-1 receptor domain-containing protein [Flavobacterium aestivum]
MGKKIFISYSWGNKEHQDWIVNLGTRLMSDTVDVVLDRWSLKDGHDIFSFMEEMVNSEEIFRVLIISNSKYQEKADEREGGVGTETQIITPKIYSNQKQDKFIPIVLERDENGNPCLPIYLSSRKYIDFSREENFEDSYEELLRNILETPSIPKPKLGINAPVYITENKINLSEINSKIRTIENQIKRNPKINPKYTVDFIEAFLENLWEFQPDEVPRDINSFGEKLVETLKAYKPLREDFIKFIELITSIEVEIDTDIIIEFFENAPIYEKPREDINSWNPAKFDVFKIIFQELFIYVIAVSLKNRNYNLTSDLLNSKYYTKDAYSRTQEPKKFSFLYNYHQNLETYMNSVYKKITGFGDYIVTNLSEQVSKENIILADTLCYVISYLHCENIYETWFPNSHLYNQQNKFTFFEKISSKKHFEKVKVIFDVEDENELKERLLKLKSSSSERIRYGNRGFEYIPFVYEIINPETIATYR